MLLGVGGLLFGSAFPNDAAPIAFMKPLFRKNEPSKPTISYNNGGWYLWVAST